MYWFKKSPTHIINTFKTVDVSHHSYAAAMLQSQSRQHTTILARRLAVRSHNNQHATRYIVATSNTTCLRQKLTVQLTSHHSVRQHQHVDAVGEGTQNERARGDDSTSDTDRATSVLVGQGAGDRTWVDEDASSANWHSLQQCNTSR